MLLSFQTLLLLSALALTANAGDSAAYSAVGWFRYALNRLEKLRTDWCQEQTPGPGRTHVPSLRKEDFLVSDSALIVVHASNLWSNPAHFEDSLRRRMKELAVHKVPAIAVIDDLSNLDTYFMENPTYHLVSKSGSHELKNRVEHPYFAGGILTECLSETVRDFILFGESTRQPPRMTFLADSIFAFGPDGRMDNLLTILSSMDEQQTFQFLKKELFKNGQFGTQQTVPRSLDLKTYSFVLLRNGKRIGTVGSGAKKVELDFSLQHGWPADLRPNQNEKSAH